MTSFGCKRGRFSVLTSTPEINSHQKQESKLTLRIQKLKEVIYAIGQSTGRGENLISSLQYFTEVRSNPDVTQQLSNMKMEWKLTLEDRKDGPCLRLTLYLDKHLCSSEICSCIKGFTCQMSAKVSVAERTLRSFAIDKIRVLDLKDNCQRRWGWTLFRLSEVEEQLDVDASLTVDLNITSIYRNGKKIANGRKLDGMAIQNRVEKRVDKCVTFIFWNDKPSDIRICIVKDEVNVAHFLCHKEVLAAKSDVFEEMFKQVAIEKGQVSVLLSDVSVKCMQKLLAFMYTGQLQDNSRDEVDSVEWVELLPDLVHAANKYKVLDLLEKCEKYLHLAVTEKNAVDIYRLAKQCGFKNATSQLRIIFSKNVDILLGSI